MSDSSAHQSTQTHLPGSTARPVRPVLDVVVLDCADALALATFYGEVLGWPVEPGSDAEWAELAPPAGRASSRRAGGSPTLAFQQIDDFVAPTWPGGEHPQQFHLDFLVPDIDAAEPAVLAAGARRHATQPSESGSFVVYLDPSGHPFCLCKESTS